MRPQPWGDYLRFAPDDDPDAGGAGVGVLSDVDKLRSEYDAKIADVNKALKAAEERAALLEAQQNSGTVYQQTIGQLAQRLDGTKDDDPEKALEKLKVVAQEMARAVASGSSGYAELESKYKNALVNYHARDIAADHGGDVASYQAELNKAKTEAELVQMAGQIAERVAGEKSKKRGNTEGSPGRRVDNGAGSAVDRSVMAELKAIDVTTPEGRADFNKREKELKRRVDAVSGS